GWLEQDRGVRFGPVLLRPQGEDPGPPPLTEGGETPFPTSRSFKQPALTEASLEFLDPTVEPSTWRVSRALVLLGRSPACKVRLTGPKVSRFHASLVRTPAGIWVVDLLSSGRVRVNGAPV